MRLKTMMIREFSRKGNLRDAESVAAILLGLDATVQEATGQAYDPANDPEFESKHPRGQGGKFTSGGGVTSQKAAPSFSGKVTTGTGGGSSFKNIAAHVTSVIAGLEKLGRPITTKEYNTAKSYIDKLRSSQGGYTPTKTPAYSGSKQAQAEATARKQEQNRSGANASSVTTAGKNWNKTHGFRSNMRVVRKKMPDGTTHYIDPDSGHDYGLAGEIRENQTASSGMASNTSKSKTTPAKTINKTRNTESSEAIEAEQALKRREREENERNRAAQYYGFKTFEAMNRNLGWEMAEKLVEIEAKKKRNGIPVF